MNAPKYLFYDYQWNWLTDPSPFKIGLWARQTGKDYTCAAEAVMDCATTPNNHWLIIACGERQAIESLQHAKYWAERLCKSESRHQKSEILFRNGSRITALPAKPETLRGYSANLILTEFAFHDHPEETWRAVFPILTNPLKAGPRKLRIISTPNGHNNKFATLWNSPTLNPNPTPNLNPNPSPLGLPASADSSMQNEKSSILNAPSDLSSASSAVIPSSKSEFKNQKSETSIFSRHHVTIHNAVGAGLPIDIPLLQRGLADTEAFAQEYECQFLDQSTVLLPYNLIATCESDLATETSTPNLLSTHPGEKFLGIDFGRKHDLTVAWLLEKVPTSTLNLSSPSAPSSAYHSPLATHHLFFTREVLILRNASTPQQIEALIPRINLSRRVCLDYTGPGIGLGNILARQFGECTTTSPHGRIALCTFTQQLKSELFTHLRSAFERRILAIPGSTDIREDLHSIYRVISNNGQISYRASHSPDGHSDRCTALALALRTAESAPVTACASTVVPRHHMFRHSGRYV